MPVAAVVALGVMAGASVYGAVQSRQMRKDAQKAADQQNALQEQAMAEEKARRNKQDAKSPDKAAYYTNMAGAGGNGLSSGLGGTLLTGGNGVITDPANIQKKTLLGQ